jgi:hypothetical protein
MFSCELLDLNSFLLLFYDIQNNISFTTKAIVRSILQGIGSTNNTVVVCFLVVASILERIEDVGANKIECMSLLKQMTKLVKVVQGVERYLRCL